MRPLIKNNPRKDERKVDWGRAGLCHVIRPRPSYEGGGGEGGHLGSPSPPPLSFLFSSVLFFSDLVCSRSRGPRRLRHAPHHARLRPRPRHDALLALRHGEGERVCSASPAAVRPSAKSLFFSGGAATQPHKSIMSRESSGRSSDGMHAFHSFRWSKSTSEPWCSDSAGCGLAAPRAPASSSSCPASTPTRRSTSGLSPSTCRLKR